MNNQFSFYQYDIQITCADLKYKPVLDWLTEDFGYFSNTTNSSENIKCKIEIISEFKKPNLLLFGASKSCKMYGWSTQRLCAYNDSTYLLDSKSKNQRMALVSGPKLDGIYEVVRNYILSVVGEHMENKGWMRFHALGLQKENLSFVFVLPSRGGKSSLATEYLSKTNVNIFSDETIFTDGINLLPLPICLALTERAAKYLGLGIQDRRSFKKALYDEKFLAPIPLNRVGKSGTIQKLFAVNSNLPSFLWSTFWGLGLSQMIEMLVRLNNLSSLFRILITRIKVLLKLLINKKIEFIKLKKPLRLEHLEIFLNSKK